MTTMKKEKKMTRQVSDGDGMKDEKQTTWNGMEGGSDKLAAATIVPES